MFKLFSLHLPKIKLIERNGGLHFLQIEERSVIQSVEGKASDKDIIFWIVLQKVSNYQFQEI